MNSSNNKIDDFDLTVELDSNQLAESSQNIVQYLNHLISIVQKMLYDKETGLDSKSFSGVARKFNLKIKRLENLLRQAHLVDSPRSIEKILAKVKELKADLGLLIPHNDKISLHFSCAIKILESLASHDTARKEGKIASYEDKKCQDLYHDFVAPTHLTSLLVYQMQHGTQDGNGESDEDSDNTDADQTPSPGSNNNGLPAASGSSVNVTDNNSDTAHANPQIALSNSMTASNIATQPTAQDGSGVTMTDNNNITSTNSSATFSNSVTLTDKPSLVSSSGFVAAANTNQGPFPVIAQETCNQSNGVYQCIGPPQLMSSSEANTVSSPIQPFHHDEAREQIQQEVEPHHCTYPEAQHIASNSVQEVNYHPNNSPPTASPLNNGTASCTEALSATTPPTLVSEVKTAVQQLSIQMFQSTLGEPHFPSVQHNASVQMGTLHTMPSQITCQATLESHATVTAHNRLDGTVYTTTTNERNEQCILGIRS